MTRSSEGPRDADLRAIWFELREIGKTLRWTMLVLGAIVGALGIRLSVGP
jgi:hypothetical protein